MVASPTIVALICLLQFSTAQAHYNCHDGDINNWSKSQRIRCCSSEQIGCPEQARRSRAAGIVTDGEKPANVEKSVEGSDTVPNVDSVLSELTGEREENALFKDFPWLKALSAEFDDFVKDHDTKQEETPFECTEAYKPMKDWEVMHRQFCCGYYGVGCEDKKYTYSCTAGDKDWEKNWTIYKRAWCCIHWSVGCKAPPSAAMPTPKPSTSPAFDCESGLANFKEDWSHAKQEWCCEREKKACSDVEKLEQTRESLYDCEDGEVDWERAWSDAKQRRCCERWERNSLWPAGADKHCCNLVGKGCEVDVQLDSTPGAHDQSGLDCESDLDSWQNMWNVTKKRHCCQHFKDTDDWPADTEHYCCLYGMACPDSEGADQSLPFDCEAGLPNWKKGWSDDKKDWCCANYKRGCPDSLDCRNESPVKWHRWKRDWCCENEGVGCTEDTSVIHAPMLAPAKEIAPDNRTDIVTGRAIAVQPSATTPPSSLGWLWPWAGSAPAPAPPGSALQAYYDCHDGPSSDWSPRKKDWCCYHEGRGCQGSFEQGVSTKTGGTSTTKDVPYDCDTGFSRWQEWWDEGKKEWCCKNENRACPTTSTSPLEYLFDCDDGYERWRDDWNAEKVSWCCRYKGKACTPRGETKVVSTTRATNNKFNCSGEFTVWERTHPDDRVDHCCRYEGKGCLPISSTTERPKFNCTNGLTNWEISWPSEKVYWCCDVQGVCPGRQETKEREEPYNCDAGFTAEAILHPDLKVKWCCEHKQKGCSLGEAVGMTATTTSIGKQGASNTTAMSVEVSASHRSSSTHSEISFDCKSDVLNAEAGWPKAKQAWCCTNQGLGCSTTSRFYNCRAGYENWVMGWSRRKQNYCCETVGKGCTGPTTATTTAITTYRGATVASVPATAHQATDISEPYDCDAGFRNWLAGWSDSKKAFCCASAQRGCSDGTTTLEVYNCEAGFDAWQLGWSDTKKEWCCRREGKGCGDEHSQGTTVEPEASQQQSISSWNADSSTGPLGGQDAKKSSTTSWDDTFTGPPVLPSTSSRLWESSSSSARYNCKGKSSLESRVAKPYNCREGLLNWARGWSDDKKKWCCTNELQWCPEWASESDKDTSDWSEEQREFCCSTEGVGCPATLVMRKDSFLAKPGGSPLARPAGTSPVRPGTALVLATGAVAALACALILGAAMRVFARHRGVGADVPEGRTPTSIYERLAGEHGEPLMVDLPESDAVP